VSKQHSLYLEEKFMVLPIVATVIGAAAGAIITEILKDPPPPSENSKPPSENSKPPSENSKKSN
jgi:hypothetical protein